MIKLNRIKVSNFKNIKEADVTFGDFNVIVGPNNSGKSNFLQVLGFLDFVINGAVHEIENGFKNNLWGAYDKVLKLSKGKTEPLVISLEFYSDFRKYNYYYTIVVESNYAELNDREAKIPTKISRESFYFKKTNTTGKAIRIFERDEHKLDLHDDLKKHKALLIDLGNEVSIVRILIALLPSNDNSIYWSFNQLKRLLTSLPYFLSPVELRKGEAVEKEVKDIRNRIVSPALGWHSYVITAIEKNPSYIDRIVSTLDITSIQHDESHKILTLEQGGVLKRLNELSDGHLLFLAYLGEIYFGTRDQFWVEEPENSLHPKALHDLLSLFREETVYGNQFIITTHSPIVVNMAKPEEIILAEINKEDGTSTIKNVPNPKELRRKLRDGFTDMSDEIFFYYGKDEDVEIID